MSPRKRLIAALAFVLPAAALVVSPAMAKTSHHKSSTHAQSHKSSHHKVAKKKTPPSNPAG